MRNKYNLIVSDTNCIINYINSNMLYILKELYNEIIITPDVLKEYMKKQTLKLPDWIKIKEPKNKNEIIKLNDIKELNLGLGECSSIVLCKEYKNSLFISDDQDARNYAIDCGLNITGSVGIVKKAKEEGIIKTNKEANDFIISLKNNGLYMSDKFLESVLLPTNENIKILNCYKYDKKYDKLIDFKGVEIFIESTEIISSKKNICKLNCKDKNGNNVFIIQRNKINKTEIWYFKDDFNSESAINFIYCREKEKKDDLSNNSESKKNKNTSKNKGR